MSGGSPLTDESVVGSDASELSVCLASPLFPPEYSGAATRFGRYAPGFLERGIRMDVVAAEVGHWNGAADHGSKHGPAMGAQPTTKNLLVRRVPLPPGGSERRKRRAYENGVVDRCRALTNPPHALISLTRSSVPTLLRLRRTGVPVIYVQTMYQEPHKDGLSEWLHLWRWRLRYELMDCIVVSSGVMRDSLRDLGVKTRVEVIPHGVDLKRFHPASTESGTNPVRTRLGLPSLSELVLFVGPINARKGVDHLITAWEEVARVRSNAYLLLVGPENEETAAGGDSFGSAVRAKLRRGAGADRVLFTGAVDDVEEYMREADVFVLPSHREGMPNVVCEAFASGVPCVLTPFLGLPRELGRPGKEYVQATHDRDALAAAIVGLLASPQERRAIGHAARRWVEENLNLDRSLDRYTAVLRGLARRSRQP